MSVLVIVGLKSTLATKHAAPSWVTACTPTGQTDGRTDAPNRYITLWTRRA